MKKKLHPKIAEVIFADHYRRTPQAKIFVIGTIFTPKIAQKCKKMANRKFTPHWGQKMYLIWESPAGGRI